MFRVRVDLLSLLSLLYAIDSLCMIRILAFVNSVLRAYYCDLVEVGLMGHCTFYVPIKYCLLASHSSK